MSGPRCRAGCKVRPPVNKDHRVLRIDFLPMDVASRAVSLRRVQGFATLFRFLDCLTRGSFSGFEWLIILSTNRQKK